MKERQDEDAAIQATAQTVAAAIREHVRRAEQRAESELKAALASVEADRKAVAAKHQAALGDVQSQLKRSEQKVQDLDAERLELQRQLKDAKAAQALAETQYQQLVAASEQLTANLSRTLNEQRAQQTAPAAAAPKRADATTPKSAPVVSPPPPSAASGKKKPIQFPGPARDAKRVRMRQGTFVSVDGMPGQLVDLSLGGAQIVLTQLVKPNQVVRATIPTAGERIICRGRIVWVVYEQPETSVAVYRTGVRFTEIDTKAVEDFMRDFAADSYTRPAAGIA
ncbi:MAG TPA: PilZ domain-containing protein [Vicinamibacterales bacterium]|nr:PilZ domain-containing protein [Vicinamibacterales bacterium]